MIYLVLTTVDLIRPATRLNGYVNAREGGEQKLTFQIHIDFKCQKFE
jgi:hypothetical protein